MLEAVFNYVNLIISIVKPRKLLYLAIDGVAPRAKMNQQRARRFSTAYEATLKQKDEQAMGVAHAQEAHWDSNAITPGTPFMEKLERRLVEYARATLGKDPRGGGGIKVIISSASVPGEGEHKLFDFIREQREAPDYDPNTRHCVLGLDADLIMLALATHELHFDVLREIQFQNNTCFICNQAGHFAVACPYRGKPHDDIPRSAPQFHYLRVCVMREYLTIIFADLLQQGYDVERLVDDFVCVCFFVGNDFLPHLPTMTIHEGALETLVGVYKALLPTFGGAYLCECGILSVERALSLLTKIAQLEDDPLLYQRAKEESAVRTVRAAGDATCFYCHKAGHYARECPEKQPRQGNGAQNSTPFSATAPANAAPAAGNATLSVTHITAQGNFSSECPMGVNPATVPTTSSPVAPQTGCFRCGAAGHFARECPNNNSVYTPATPQPKSVSPSSSPCAPQGGCFRCGAGHFARDCPNSSALPVTQPPTSGSPSSSCCHHCGQPGHWARNCPKGITSGSPAPTGQTCSPPPGANNTCYYCNMAGHFARYCPNKGSATGLLQPERTQQSLGNELNGVNPTRSRSRPRSRPRSGTPIEEDLIRMGEPGFRDRYYTVKFSKNKQDTEGRRFFQQIGCAYIEGLVWVLHYYYRGCPSWGWFYPFHYAPLAGEIAEFVPNDFQVNFTLGEPLKPLEQLLAVLPPSSGKQMLPPCLASLMTDLSSPLFEFYPDKIVQDTEGGRSKWHAVVLLPFVDEKLLLGAAREREGLLSSEDAMRNTNQDGAVLLVHSQSHPHQLAREGELCERSVV
eukprot:TRINITY_DN4424_c0_g1_i1.p1 TRINITY_DN4424_c0_g1~~TRINITY_DN4424_c0_g1_i1.p1  ORF type:complete len:886 (+),score=140.38 TRINITY_DN4424_c0_g1_i1:262-2658(+)